MKKQSDIRRYLTDSGRDVVGEWLTGLQDVRARAKIATRISRLEAANFGGCKPLGEGVWESRIDWGPGYQVYDAIVGSELELLLCGGDKRKQAAGHSESGRVPEGLPKTDGIPMKRKASVSHEDAIVKELRDDPDFAAE